MPATTVMPPTMASKGYHTCRTYNGRRTRLMPPEALEAIKNV